MARPRCYVVVLWILSMSLTANGQTRAEDLRRAGIDAYSLYDLAEAERLFRGALRIAEDNEEHNEAGMDRIALGEVYHAMGRFTEARRAYEEALPIFKHEQHFNEVVIVLTGLASMSATQQKYTEAVTYLNEATALLSKIEPAGSEAELRTTNVFGMVYFAQRKYDTAEKYFRKAVAIASERDVVVGEFPAVGLVEILNNLGSVYLSQRKYKIAEETYIRALDLAQNAVGPSHPALAGMYFNLGSLYLNTDRLANADANLRRSLEIAAQGKTAPTIFVIRNLAMLSKVQLRMGQAATADALLTRALEIARNNARTRYLIPDVLETYSQVLQSLHRPVEARNAFEEARQIRAQQALIVRVR
jgi:tetratricopeptide (TPR) repeat protein